MLKPEEVRSRIGNIPYMTIEQANCMTDHITKHKLKSVIELGFYHGASTCYIANAVSQFDDGKVVAIDKLRAKTIDPNVETLLKKLDLGNRVEIFYEDTSYLWRMMKFLEKDPTPCFDLCYLDGAHNWFVDGFAFFLVDKLLKPGGWIILDDLDFCYNNSQGMQGTDSLAAMPSEERECRQVRNVYELLIKTQPGYCNFREEDNWAFAQKSTDTSAGSAQITTEIIVKEKQIGLGSALIKLGKRLGMR